MPARGELWAIDDSREPPCRSDVVFSERGGRNTVRAFVERVASSDPVPGGGSVAAGRSARRSAGANGDRNHGDEEEPSGTCRQILEALCADPYRVSLLDLVDADADAYNKWRPTRFPGNSSGREDAIQNALIHATEVSPVPQSCVRSTTALEDLRPVIHRMSLQTCRLVFDA
jgi:formiminotetrahydrofolate cyclodeaminase